MRPFPIPRLYAYNCFKLFAKSLLCKSFYCQVFPAELPVFLKEHKLGMYRTDVYFIAKTLAEVN